jgi:hypothetical protein
MRKFERRPSHSINKMKPTIFRAFFRPSLSPSQHERAKSLKLTGHQPTWHSSAKLDDWRTCFVCNRRRSYSARRKRETGTLDQVICSRQQCAALKSFLTQACSSGRLTVEIHHHPCSSIAEVAALYPSFVSELHGHSSTAGQVELPGDFPHQLPDQVRGRVCSRRHGAKLKCSSAKACGSGTLTIEIDHYHHSNTAELGERPPSSISELDGNSSTAGWAELPGDFMYQLLSHDGRLATIPEEPPWVDRSTKPSQEAVADCLSSGYR